jgi:signal peptidase II
VARRGLRPVLWSLLVAAGVVVLDQATKHWAVNALADGHTIDLVWTLRFNLAYNTGMAFSSGNGLGPLVPILALAVVVVLLITVGRSSSPWSVVAVGLVIGGAVGNVTDRLLRGEGGLHGAVVDFIDLQWWPIFNVADIAVVVGGGLLVLTALRS